MRVQWTKHFSSDTCVVAAIGHNSISKGIGMMVLDNNVISTTCTMYLPGNVILLENKMLNYLLSSSTMSSTNTKISSRGLRKVIRIFCTMFYAVTIVFYLDTSWCKNELFYKNLVVGINLVLLEWLLLFEVLNEKGNNKEKLLSGSLRNVRMAEINTTTREWIEFHIGRCKIHLVNRTRKAPGRSRGRAPGRQ